MIPDGAALDFGAGDLTFTATGIGTFKVQSFDLAKKAKVEVVADAGGTTISRTYYDGTWEASVEAVISGTGLADALLQTKLPEIGTLATSASTKYAWLNTLVWTVEDASIKATNTKNKIVSFKFLYTPAITAVASA